jgi:exo-1,4-beta-D-glucosaminidase
MTPDLPGNLSDVYFLKLVLTDAADKELSSNLYWLSSKKDEKADFTALNSLPEISLKYSVSPLRKENGKCFATIEFENLSGSLAFFINPAIIRRDSKDLVLPVFWEDNYFSLMPKEKREVTVGFDQEDLKGENPVLVIDGWNISRTEKELK